MSSTFLFFLAHAFQSHPAHCVGVPLGCKAFGVFQLATTGTSGNVFPDAVPQCDRRPVERESPACAQQEAHSLRPSLRRVLRRCGGSIPCIVVFRIHIIDPILEK
ncbi:hypothetical protein EDB84DRAFT_1546166 [Lactarius hengduanensis]|nr:hypothetical protein EDB84DRAFT_1546166 [Lactarius hengduanensis]